MSTCEKNLEGNDTEISKNLEVITTKNKDSKSEEIMDKKRNKIKKVKDKTLTGRKRKCSDKIEFNQKIKRKKKELSSLDLNKDLSNIVDITAENLMPIDNTHEKSKTEKKKKQNNMNIIELDSDAENKEIISQKKNKPILAKKIKSITNACRDALQILIKLGSDVLTLIDMSLKILKSHDFLDNKLISNETLLKLIDLALVSIKANGDADADGDTGFSKIFASLYISPSPKSSKAKKNIINQSNDVQKKAVASEEAFPNFDSKYDEEIIVEPEIIILENTEKVLNLSEENDEQVSSVEKSGKNLCITNYFKKMEKATEEKQNTEKLNFLTPRTNKHFDQKSGKELSDVRRRILEAEMENQTSETNYLIECAKYINKISLKNKKDLSLMEIQQFERRETEKKDNVENETTKKCGEGSEVEFTIKKVDFAKIDVIDSNSEKLMSKNKAKLFQFHDNRRPPYWGTWRRKSNVVRGRKPFGKDKLFNYEVDSDDEWEEEPGESLHGSDEEKEPEEDYEVDNDFFVPHGYLSDDENPEKENMSPKTKLRFLEEQFSFELKQKTKKMTPIVFGTYWENKKSPSKDSRFEDLELGKIQYVYWVTPPIQIQEEETEKNNDCTLELEPNSQTKKTRNKTMFPETEVPNLIKIVHGSPHNSNWLAKKFLEQRDPEQIDCGKLTKICVLKKIKELATRQVTPDKKMCWHVPKDIRMEFKTEGELEKKSKKCYIWKFVKKGNKTSGLPIAVPEEPEIIVLEPSATENS